MMEKTIRLTVDGVKWQVFSFGYPNEELIAVPIEEHRGWSTIENKDLTKRMQFKCGVCGRVSNGPDKTCQVGRVVILTSVLRDSLKEDSPDND